MDGMRRLVVVCLPGMDGTRELREAFARSAPEWARVVMVEYPSDRKVGYGELVEIARGKVPAGEAWIVVAESFSGAVGVKMCMAGGGANQGLVGLVLVNSFLTAPLGGLMRVVPLGLALMTPVFEWAVRLVLLSGPSETTAGEVKRAIEKAGSEVLAYRAGLVARLDIVGEMSRVVVPVLAVCGAGDRVVWRSKGEEIARANPRVTRRVVEGPHMLLQARPREVWGEIEGFVKALGVVGSA